MANKKWREDSSTVYRAMRKREYQRNRDINLARAKAYAESHKEEKAAYDRVYRKQNESVRRPKIKEWENNSKEHRVRRRLRRLFNHFIHGESKEAGAALVGCSYEFYRHYIETLFKEGMTWDNHGNNGWHIDHIKPLAAFDLSDEDEVRKCFHYTNTHPIWCHENLKKGKKCKREN